MKYPYKIMQEEDFFRLSLPEEISVVENVLLDMEGMASPVYFEYVEKALKDDGSKIIESGNMTTLEIAQGKTRCKNDFGTSETQTECEIETIELQKIFKIWMSVNSRRL